MLKKVSEAGRPDSMKMFGSQISFFSKCLQMRWKGMCIVGKIIIRLILLILMLALKTNIQIKIHFIPYVCVCHTIVFILRPVILLKQ